jgi:hypothetical protein
MKSLALALIAFVSFSAQAALEDIPMEMKVRCGVAQDAVTLRLSARPESVITCTEEATGARLKQTGDLAVTVGNIRYEAKVLIANVSSTCAKIANIELFLKDTLADYSLVLATKGATIRMGSSPNCQGRVAP